MPETLLAFLAGRAFRREGSNTVESDPKKGAIIIVKDDDELLHFTWKSRTRDPVVEDLDLIMFPSDATFTLVPQSPSGRVYILKFLSSNQKHFFWMQDASSVRNSQFAANVNGLWQNPDYVLQWSNDTSGDTQGSTSSSSQAATRPQTDAGNSAFSADSETLERFLSQMEGEAADGARADVFLLDILTPANIMSLIASRPELVPVLFAHLPADMPGPPSAESLESVVRSVQFRAAVPAFDLALRRGTLGGLVRGLGLPEEAGTGVVSFLQAVQDQADKENGDNKGNSNMDTD